MTRSVVIGIGLSSAATAEEVATMVDAALADHRLAAVDVAAVATRERFVGDPRLALGWPVVGFSDDDLMAASAPTDRTIGIPARVAETAARLGAAGRSGVPHLLAATRRSAHATLALVTAGRPPAPGAHGGDAARIAAALGLDPASMVDLSASLNPFAPDVTALACAALERDAVIVTSYPDAAPARAALAEAVGTDPDRLVLTNGAAEAIALVAAAVGGHVVEPEFSLYPRADDRRGPRWRSNPSNPGGRLADADDRAGVWDEAFFPLATGRWTRGDDDAWRIGSLTKLWSCPGLRLGFAIAPTGAGADDLRGRQPAWAVNGLAVALLPELLAVTDLTGWQSSIGDLRSRLADELRHLGFAVAETDVNWVIVDEADLRDRLAPLGIVVRDLASFGMAGRFRVALPRPGQLDRVLTAFARIGPTRP